jgi:lysophospholipase L1-like esterase
VLLSVLGTVLAGLVGPSSGAAVPQPQLVSRPGLSLGSWSGTPSPFPATATAQAGPATSDGPVRKIRVTAIGDSVTAGTACQCTAFPALYAAALARDAGSDVEVFNDGQGGETSRDVEDDLRDDLSERAEIAGSDVVVVTIGANDFGDHYDKVTNAACGGDDQLDCVRDELSALQGNLQTIMDTIRSLRGNRSTAILITGYWNVFQDGEVARKLMPEAGLAGTAALTVVANQTMLLVAEHNEATYIDLYRAFKGSDGQADPTALLAPDGDHPNAVGHQLIAQTLLDAGVAPLTAVRR